MTSGDVLSRRSFIARVSAVGGGLALAIALPFEPARTAEEAREVTAWLVGYPSGQLNRYPGCARRDGAGGAGLAMLVAEELECDWSRVRHSRNWSIPKRICLPGASGAIHHDRR